MHFFVRHPVVADVGGPANLGGNSGRPGLRGRGDDCVYRRGGDCTRHGPGAKLYWKPLRPPVAGPDGVLKTRKYYYSCDIGPRGRGRLRQQRLSFRKTTPEDEDNPDKDDSEPRRNNFGVSDDKTSVGK